jgi:MoxR-like ATPase
MKDVVERMTKEVHKVVVGQDDAVEFALCAAAVGGHVLIEGVPGVAKTLLANALARTMALTFKRVQFTPDTRPSDLTGAMGQGQLGTTFHPGPVFTNVLLADEVNRTPPHTQAALLEAMQEHQVSVAGQTHVLPEPFFVLATQNPLSHAGTYPLPVSQLDRFLVRIRMNYPGEDEEIEILALDHHGLVPATLLDVATAITGADFLEARRVVDATHVSPGMLRLIARFVQSTRAAPALELGASPRAGVHLLGASKAHARMNDRDHITVDDVERMAIPVLGHRVVLAQNADTDVDQVLRRLLLETRMEFE